MDGVETVFKLQPEGQSCCKMSKSGGAVDANAQGLEEGQDPSTVEEWLQLSGTGDVDHT